LMACQHRQRPDPPRARLHARDIGDIGRIAQSILRPCAVSGTTWAGLADQRDTMAGELVGETLDRQR
jgi:hypothetical protein